MVSSNYAGAGNLFITVHKHQIYVPPIVFKYLQLVAGLRYQIDKIEDDYFALYLKYDGNMVLKKKPDKSEFYFVAHKLSSKPYLRLGRYQYQLVNKKDHFIFKFDYTWI
jgi:hypothetical protein